MTPDSYSLLYSPSSCPVAEKGHLKDDLVYLTGTPQKYEANSHAEGRGIMIHKVGGVSKGRGPRALSNV